MIRLRGFRGMKTQEDPVQPGPLETKSTSKFLDKNDLGEGKVFGQPLVGTTSVSRGISAFDPLLGPSIKDPEEHFPQALSEPKANQPKNPHEGRFPSHEKLTRQERYCLKPIQGCGHVCDREKGHFGGCRKPDFCKKLIRVVMDCGHRTCTLCGNYTQGLGFAPCEDICYGRLADGTQCKLPCHFPQECEKMGVL